jgi:hypothetical protein
MNIVANFAPAPSYIAVMVTRGNAPSSEHLGRKDA